LHNRHLPSYSSGMPRRRAGTLLPLEQEILRTGLRFSQDGERFHGFGLAAALEDGHRSLIAHGTLYKALARLQEAGHLHAVWEDPVIAESAGRPRRKLYEVTATGAAALEAAERPVAAPFRVVTNPSTL
jgi:PadR family transcriptional regulator PadR